MKAAGETSRRNGPATSGGLGTAGLHVGPAIRSIDRWKRGAPEVSDVVLTAKTRVDRCEALAYRAKALHPYELPEVLELSVASGRGACLEWVKTESAS